MFLWRICVFSHITKRIYFVYRIGNNASELNSWIYPPSRSENVTHGGNKARSTNDVTPMVGGANTKTERFFDIAVIELFPLLIIRTK